MTEFAKYNAKDISGLSVPRMSGKQDYLDEIKAIWFEFGRKSGLEEAEARIIKLLEGIRADALQWDALGVMTKGFDIALDAIKGEK